MFNDLMRKLQPPGKFKKSDKMFWQDPHIATYLLEAHLDSSNEGASRTFEFIDQSVDFIEKVAPQKDYGTVIDYGCGPGLYCERLSKRGYDVTGIDFSENSIQYAIEQAKNNGLDIDYHYENYLDVSIENQYELATLIYCDYCALAPHDRKQLLENIWRSLKNDGMFLLDVFTNDKYKKFEEESNWYHRDEGGFWSAEAHIELTQNLTYDGHVTLEQTTIMTEQAVDTYYIWHQFFTREKIVAELENIGFTLLAIYNDVTGTEYHEGNDTIALLLKK